MTLKLPPEIEQHVNDLVVRGAYPSAEAVLADAVRSLVRDQERKEIESLLDESGLDHGRIEQLLQEAESSGDYTELTARDWEEIQREGIATVNARKSR